MEKFDPSDEEDGSLDATIGYVADYETSISRAPGDASGGPGGASGGGQASGGFGAGADHLSSMAALQRDGRLARDTASAAAAGR